MLYFCTVQNMITLILALYHMYTPEIIYEYHCLCVSIYTVGYAQVLQENITMNQDKVFNRIIYRESSAFLLLIRCF